MGWCIRVEFINYGVAPLQGRNRDADVKKGFVDMGKRGGTNWDTDTAIHTLSRVN